MPSLPPPRLMVAAKALALSSAAVCLVGLALPMVVSRDVEGPGGAGWSTTGDARGLFEKGCGALQPKVFLKPLGNFKGRIRGIDNSQGCWGPSGEAACCWERWAPQERVRGWAFLGPHRPVRCPFPIRSTLLPTLISPIACGVPRSRRSTAKKNASPRRREATDAGSPGSLRRPHRCRRRLWRWQALCRARCFWVDGAKFEN